MGKKRRILTRTTKFAKKYFEFLDKADGADDDIIGDGDTFIDSIAVADNSNETVTVTGRVLGGGHTTGNVEISVDGGAFGIATATTLDAGAGPSGGLDEVAYSITTGVLGKGTHTVRVRKASETNEALYSETKSIDVIENKIVLTVDADAFTDTNANQIKFDASKVVVAAGDWKDKAGSTDLAFLGQGGPAGTAAIALRITVSHNGTAKSILNEAGGGAALLQTIAKTTTFTNDTQDIDALLAAAANAAGEPLEGGVVGTTTAEFACTVTPVDSAGVVLEDSSVTQVVTVTERA